LKHFVAMRALLLCLLATAAGAQAGSWDASRRTPLEQDPAGHLYRTGYVLLEHDAAARFDLFDRVAELGGFVAGEVPRYGYMLVELPSGEGAIPSLARYAELAGVRRASLDFVGEGGGGTPPDDPKLSNQWHHEQGNDADLDSFSAWEIETGDPSVVLAVLDTGIDANHPDLSGPRFLGGFDFVNEDSVPNADHAHGVWVTGLAAANTNNAIQVAGVDRECTVLPIKVLDANNQGSSFDLVQGIEYATANGADILSMSLINFGSNLNFALSQAKQESILIACAGNGGVGDADNSFPGASPHTISIGATTSGDNRASFSGTGNKLDFVAPGSSVVTVGLGYGANGSAFFSGCSAATPVAAGVVALLKARFPGIDQDCTYTLLLAGAEDEVGNPAEDTPGWDTFYGHGRLNAFASLTAQTACSSNVLLFSDDELIDLVDGGSQTFQLEAGPDSAGEIYLLLGSITGSEPGIPLGTVTLPLNPDPYFSFTLANMNSAALPNTLGLLDVTGGATASLVIPPATDVSLAGITLRHAYATIDGLSFAGASNAIDVRLVTEQEVFAEDFGGDLSGWSFEGLWHVEEPGDCGAPSRGAAFNDGPGVCDYTSVLGANSNLSSPPFLLAGYAPLRVQLTSTLEVEGSPFTIVSVRIEDASNSFLTETIAGLAGFTPDGQSETLEFGVSDSWANTEVRLVFNFTTFTPTGPALGWRVDDVRVTAKGP